MEESHGASRFRAAPRLLRHDPARGPDTMRSGKQGGMPAVAVPGPPSADHARSARPAPVFSLPPSRVAEPGAQIEI